MNALDIVVNLWTPDLTASYTPKLDAFWKKASRSSAWTIC